MGIARINYVNLDKNLLIMVTARIVRIIHGNTMMVSSACPMNVHLSRNFSYLDYVKIAHQGTGNLWIRKVVFRTNVLRNLV